MVADGYEFQSQQMTTSKRGLRECVDNPARIAYACEKQSGVGENFYREEGSQARSGGKRCANAFVPTLRPISRPASISMR